MGFNSGFKGLNTHEIRCLPDPAESAVLHRDAVVPSIPPYDREDWELPRWFHFSGSLDLLTSLLFVNALNAVSISFALRLEWCDI